MATIPKRHLFAYITASAAGDAQATAALASHRVSKARKATKSAPRRAKEKESKDARRERIAAIRAEVFRLAGGECECAQAADIAGTPATELHHILSGSDRRRLEATDNCVALCHPCHADANEGYVLDALLKIPRLSAEARRALQRRIDKLETR